MKENNDGDSDIINCVRSSDRDKRVLSIFLMKVTDLSNLKKIYESLNWRRL